MTVPDSATLEFYAAPAPMTALPWDTHGEYLGDLPVDVAALAVASHVFDPLVPALSGGEPATLATLLRRVALTAKEDS